MMEHQAMHAVLDFLPHACAAWQRCEECLGLILQLPAVKREMGDLLHCR